MAKPCCFTLKESDGLGNGSVRRIPNDAAAKSSAAGLPEALPCAIARISVVAFFKCQAQLGSC